MCVYIYIFLSLSLSLSVSLSLSLGVHTSHSQGVHVFCRVCLTGEIKSHYSTMVTLLTDFFHAVVTRRLTATRRVLIELHAHDDPERYRQGIAITQGFARTNSPAPKISGAASVSIAFIQLTTSVSMLRYLWDAAPYSLFVLSITLINYLFSKPKGQFSAARLSRLSRLILRSRLR